MSFVFHSDEHIRIYIYCSVAYLLIKPKTGDVRGGGSCRLFGRFRRYERILKQRRWTAVAKQSVPEAVLTGRWPSVQKGNWLGGSSPGTNNLCQCSARDPAVIHLTAVVVSPRCVVSCHSSSVPFIEAADGAGESPNGRCHWNFQRGHWFEQNFTSRIVSYNFKQLRSIKPTPQSNGKLWYLVVMWRGKWRHKTN